MADQYMMQDPTKQYPQLKIPEQRQDEPGLDAKLQPQADHGEETYRGSDRLKGRKALITGADSGIGAAVAIAMAREGADICMCYLESEEADAQKIAKLVEDAGRKCITCPGDISDEAFCQKLVETANAELGGLDIIVNNAGRQLSCDSLLELETKQLHSTFATNIFAMFYICKAALPHLPAGASIINTTSIQAYEPSPTLLDYASTKAAIANFTKSLSAQLVDKGIRVNAVAPGPILWPDGGAFDELARQRIISHTPLRREGTPDDVARAVHYLLADAPYVTGETINVDGGVMME